MYNCKALAAAVPELMHAWQRRCNFHRGKAVKLLRLQRANARFYAGTRAARARATRAHLTPCTRHRHRLEREFHAQDVCKNNARRATLYTTLRDDVHHEIRAVCLPIIRQVRYNVFGQTPPSGCRQRSRNSDRRRPAVELQALTVACGIPILEFGSTVNASLSVLRLKTPQRTCMRLYGNSVQNL